MDYPELIAAIKQNNNQKINALIKKIRPRLLAFLCIHMNASKTDAEDIVQESLIKAIEVIKEDRVNNPKRVVNYIITICKNKYLKSQQKKGLTSIEDVSEPEERMAPPQLQALLDKEQNRLLRWCLQQLKAEYQKYMQYWFNHPDVPTKNVAHHFDISISNAWTRKHRLIKKLNECYQKKSNL